MRRWAWASSVAVCGAVLLTGCSEQTVVAPETSAPIPPSRPGVRVERGSVQFRHLHLARHADSSTLIYDLSEDAVVTASVLDGSGRPIGSSVVRQAAGPVVQTIRLTRPSKRLRVLLSAVPTAGGRTTSLDFTPGQNPRRPRILSPVPGKAIEANDVTLRVRADDLELERPDRHLDVVIDGGEHMSLEEATVTLEDLTPGPHTVSVRAADAEHQPVSDEASVNFHNTGRLAVSPQQAVRRGHHLYPHPGMIAHSTEPVLAWDEVADATHYTITITEAESAREVHSALSFETRYSVAPGVLTAERHYIWEVWPHEAGGAKADEPYGVSWFAIHPRGDGPGAGHGDSGAPMETETEMGMETTNGGTP